MSRNRVISFFAVVFVHFYINTRGSPRLHDPYIKRGCDVRVRFGLVCRENGNKYVFQDILRNIGNNNNCDGKAIVLSLAMHHAYV